MLAAKCDAHGGVTLADAESKAGALTQGGSLASRVCQSSRDLACVTLGVGAHSLRPYAASCAEACVHATGDTSGCGRQSCKLCQAARKVCQLMTRRGLRPGEACVQQLAVAPVRELWSQACFAHSSSPVLQSTGSHLVTKTVHSPS